MQRLSEQNLLAWMNSRRRKPLVIRGARQVGKTWLVEKVLANKFDSYVKVDLEIRRDLHDCFAGNLEPANILKSIEFVTGRIIPGRTLLFFAGNP